MTVVSNAIILSTLLMRRGPRDDVILPLYGWLLANRRPLGRPLGPLMDEMPADLRLELSRWILYSPVARWGLLGPRTEQNGRLARDLAADQGTGPYRDRLAGFRRRHPEYFEPLSRRVRDELGRARQLADQHRLVGFPTGRDAWGFIRVARALAGLTGESERRVEQLRSAYLFHQIELPEQDWRAMLAAYRSRPNFLAFAPLLQVSHAWDKRPDLQLNLSSWGRLLGFDLQSGRWISRHAGLTNQEIAPGFTLVKPARVVDGQPCTVHPHCYLAERQHLSLKAGSFDSPARISHAGHVGVDLGYQVVTTEQARRLQGRCFSGREWRAAQLIDWTAGDPGAGDRPDRRYLVIPFCPDAWQRDYPAPELFPRAHDRAKTFHRIMDVNPVTKPAPDRLVKKPHDRARTFRRTMQAGYRLDRMGLWINHDFKFRAQGIQFSQADIDLMVQALRDPAAADRLADTFGIVHQTQDRRSTSVPSAVQLRWDRLVQLPLSAALSTVSKKLLGGRLSTFLPGTCPWLSGASNLWEALSPRFSAANLDVKNCFPSLDHRNPELPRMIDETRRLLEREGLADEGRCIAEACHYYLGLLRRGRYRFSCPVPGQIPSGFVLTPLFWYCLVVPACRQLERAVENKLIRTWDLAGDDLVCIAGPDPDEQTKQVLRPWFEMAARLNLQFHFWKNYRERVVDWRTDPSSVIPVDHGQHYRSAWVDRFPVDRLPFYHAGVSFYRRQIVVVDRLAGEQLELLERAQVRANMLAKHLRRSKEDAGSTLAPLVLIRALQRPELSSDQLSSPRSLAQEEGDLTPREGHEGGPGNGDGWKRMVEALAQGPLGHAGRQVSPLTVRPRRPGWTAAAPLLSAVDADDVNMFLAAEPTTERARRAQFGGQAAQIDVLAVDRYRQLLAERRWREAARLVADRWLRSPNIPDKQSAARLWGPGAHLQAMLPIEAELALHLPVRFPRTGAAIDRALRYGGGEWTEVFKATKTGPRETNLLRTFRNVLRWTPLVWYYRETGFISDEAAELIRGTGPLVPWVECSHDGRFPVGTWRSQLDVGADDWVLERSRQIDQMTLPQLRGLARMARWKLARMSTRMAERFDRIADQPGQVERLRQILERVESRRSCLEGAAGRLVKEPTGSCEATEQNQTPGMKAIEIDGLTMEAGRLNEISTQLDTATIRLDNPISNDSLIPRAGMDVLTPVRAAGQLDNFLTPARVATVPLNNILPLDSPVGLDSIDVLTPVRTTVQLDNVLTPACSTTVKLGHPHGIQPRPLDTFKTLHGSALDRLDRSGLEVLGPEPMDGWSHRMTEEAARIN